MPYRIGLDARMHRHTGIGTYLRGLLGGFHEIGFGGDRGLTVWGAAPASATRKTSRDPFALKAPIYSLEEQLEYPRALRQCELWHAPHYNVPFFKGTAKLVVTIHDVIHWIFRRQFRDPMKKIYADAMMRRALRTADHVIAVSENTRQDLIRYFQADPEKITMIHEGVSRKLGAMPPDELAVRFDGLQTKYGLPDDFFLYVGMLKPHKNVLRLVRVFRRLREANRLRSALVLVGKKDKRYSGELKELAALRSGGGILHIPEAASDELQCLYNKALALVHPSLYEGFGLTVLEAMKCGAPVISSNAASLPEVAGDAALLFDPASEPDLADAMIKIESDPALRDGLRQKGRVRAAQFEWGKTAERTVEVYERVLAEK